MQAQRSAVAAAEGSSAPAPAAQAPLPALQPTTQPPLPPQVAPQPPAHAALPTDANKLHASLLRARMLGDTARAAALEAQIAALATAPPPVLQPPPQPPQQSLKRARVEEAPAASGAAVVLVSTLDSRGLPIASLQAAPAGLTRDDIRGGSRAGRLSGSASLHGAGGARLGYFAEDAAAGGGGGAGAAVGSAALAAEAQRLRGVAAALARSDASAEGAEPMAQRLARNIAGNARYRGEGARDGSGRGEAEDDGDAAAALLASRGAQLTERERQARDMARAVAAHKEGERAIARCPLCQGEGAGAGGSSGLRQGLMVSRGRHCMLLLPPQGQRFPGHLLLAPIAHVCAATDMVRVSLCVCARVRVCSSCHLPHTLPPHTPTPYPPPPFFFFFFSPARRRRRCMRS